MSSSSTPAAETVTRAAEPPSAPEVHRSQDTPRRAWRAYFEATQMLTEALERCLKEQTGLSLADYNALLVLHEAPEGRLRMGELAAKMIFSPSRVTYQVKCLVARGLVERRAVECDRRGFEAVLTDEGRSAFRRAAAIHTRQVDEVFLDGLEPAEAETLLRVFSRLGATLEDRG